MYRLDTETARSPQRRELIAKFYRILVAYMVCSFVALVSLVLGLSILNTRPIVYAELLIGLLVISFLFDVALTRLVPAEHEENRPAGDRRGLSGAAGRALV